MRWRATIIPVKNQQLKSFNILGVVATGHPPYINAVVLGAPRIRIVIAYDMQGLSVRLIEHVDDVAVLRTWICKIAQLQNGIWLAR